MSEDLRKIAGLYDRKREDLNYFLSLSDGLIHHHNGICDPQTVFADDLKQEEIMRLLHQMETDLTELGIGLLGARTPGSIGLDAGCGRGGSAIMLNNILDCSVVGVNISEYQLGVAKELVAKRGIANRVNLVLADMTETSLEDSVFDFVWACESPEHVVDLRKMFREFYRVSKANADLLIIAWCVGMGNSEAGRISTLVNQAYVTELHSLDEYANAAKWEGWKDDSLIDLRAQTAAYWR